MTAPAEASGESRNVLRRSIKASAYLTRLRYTAMPSGANNIRYALYRSKPIIDD